MYQKTILDNGLRLITHTMPGMESAAIGVWVRVGGRYESQHTKGAAHFLEHLVFKGSRKYSCQEIKESIEGVGGALNGFTSEESTCYFAKLPAVKQLQALDILTDMVITPLLKSSDIRKERFVILEEIKMYRDLPQSYVNDILDELLWPDHPLGLSILGSRENILKLKREDIAEFQKQYYLRSNMVIAACGKIKHKEILKRLRGMLGQARLAGENEFIPAAKHSPGPKIKILKKPTAQTHMALGFYGINRDHPDKHIYSLLHIILGANMSSRLFSQVREKRGLAYEIRTQIKGLSDTGVFLVHAGVDNAKLYQAVEIIIKELAKIKSKAVLSSELRRGKEFYIGQLRLALEDTLDHMFWIGEPTLHLNKTYDFPEILKEIRAISPEDLRRVAKGVFKSETARLAIIGPSKEESKLHACIGKL